MNRKKVKLAIFDIDGTIFRSSLVVELVRGMVERGVFPKLAWKEVERQYLAWLDRKGAYEDFIKKIVEIHLRYIKGKPENEVRAVARLVINYQKDRVYRFTRDLIKELQRKNYLLLAISGSPTYAVSEFARRAGFDAHFGSVYEIKKGVYTGKVLNLDSVNRKAKVVGEFLASKNLMADFKRSVAVGDTESDTGMLELAGRAIAFNPNRALAVLAVKKKWEIVVERKDVVYKIKNFGFLT